GAPVRPENPPAGLARLAPAPYPKAPSVRPPPWASGFSQSEGRVRDSGPLEGSAWDSRAPATPPTPRGHPAVAPPTAGRQPMVRRRVRKRADVRRDARRLRLQGAAPGTGFKVAGRAARARAAPERHPTGARGPRAPGLGRPPAGRGAVRDQSKWPREPLAPEPGRGPGSKDLPEPPVPRARPRPQSPARQSPRSPEPGRGPRAPRAPPAFPGEVAVSKGYAFVDSACTQTCFVAAESAVCGGPGRDADAGAPALGTRPQLPLVAPAAPASLGRACAIARRPCRFGGFAHPGDSLRPTGPAAAALLPRLSWRRPAQSEPRMVVGRPPRRSPRCPRKLPSVATRQLTRGEAAPGAVGSSPRVTAARAPCSQHGLLTPAACGRDTVSRREGSAPGQCAPSWHLQWDTARRARRRQPAGLGKGRGASARRSSAYWVQQDVPFLAPLTAEYDKHVEELSGQLKFCQNADEKGSVCCRAAPALAASARVLTGSSRAGRSTASRGGAASSVSAAPAPRLTGETRHLPCLDTSLGARSTCASRVEGGFFSQFQEFRSPDLEALTCSHGREAAAAAVQRPFGRVTPPSESEALIIVSSGTKASVVHHDKAAGLTDFTQMEVCENKSSFRLSPGCGAADVADTRTSAGGPAGRFAESMPLTERVLAALGHVCVHLQGQSWDAQTDEGPRRPTFQALISLGCSFRFTSAACSPFLCASRPAELQVMAAVSTNSKPVQQEDRYLAASQPAGCRGQPSLLGAASPCAAGPVRPRAPLCPLGAHLAGLSQAAATPADCVLRDFRAGLLSPNRLDLLGARADLTLASEAGLRCEEALARFSRLHTCCRSSAAASGSSRRKERVEVLLHCELKNAVEKQLEALPLDTELGSGVCVDGEAVRSLQEQLQLSLQILQLYHRAFLNSGCPRKAAFSEERGLRCAVAAASLGELSGALASQEKAQAVELWQTASRELERLQKLYQEYMTEAHVCVVESQKQKVISEPMIFWETDKNLRAGGLVEQLTGFQHLSKHLHVANESIEMTNQQFLRTISGQSAEIELLRKHLRYSQNRQAKLDLRVAAAKVEELTRVTGELQGQMQRKEEDVAAAQGREEASDRRTQQLQTSVRQLESQLHVAIQDASQLRAERVRLERQAQELQAKCTELANEKDRAVVAARNSLQLLEDANLQKSQALLEEKQKEEDIENMRKSVSRLLQDAALRTRKEVTNTRKQYLVQISRLTEELSALQLECAEKQSQIERATREKKAVEEELDKVQRDGAERAGEPGRLEEAQRRCLAAERTADELRLGLRAAESRARQLELSSSEELSRLQDVIQRLQGVLEAERAGCGAVSEQRLQLQQENEQLHREAEALRKVALEAQKTAKLKISTLEHEFSIKERGFEVQLREMEDSGRDAAAELRRLLATQQKAAGRWKEEAKKARESAEARIFVEVACKRLNVVRQNQYCMFLSALCVCHE
ncbi:Sodium channel and clathrin linker 1, partial [Galemys pyrenaicus]